LEVRKMGNRDNYFRIIKQGEQFRIKLGSTEIFFRTYNDAKMFGDKVRDGFPELIKLNASLLKIYDGWNIADNELMNDNKYSNNRNANKKTRYEDSLRNLSISFKKQHDELLENKAKIEAENLAGNNNSNITKLLRINILRIFIVIILLYFSKIGIQQHRYFMLLSQHYLKLHDALELYKNGISELDFDRLVQSLSMHHNFKDVESEMDKLIEIMKK